MDDEAVGLLRALLDDDSAAAMSAVERCRNAGLSRAEVLERVLVPALATLGQEWAHGRVDDDGFAAAGVAADQVIAFAAPPEVAPDTGISVVVGCPIGDGHPALAAVTASVLGLAGHRVTDLGAEASASAFLEAVQASNADVVVVCGSTTTAVSGVSSIASLLESGLVHGPAIIAVGAPFASDRTTLDSGRVLGVRDAIEAVGAVQRSFLPVRPADPEEGA